MKKYLIILLFLFIALPASAYDFGSKEYQVETAYLGILNRHPRIDEVQFFSSHFSNQTELESILNTVPERDIALNSIYQAALSRNPQDYEKNALKHFVAPANRIREQLFTSYERTLAIENVYIGILGRRPSQNNLDFYIITRSPFDKIKNVLSNSYEREIKINEQFNRMICRNATVTELSTYKTNQEFLHPIRLQLADKYNLYANKTNKEGIGQDFFINNLVDSHGGVWCTARTGWQAEPEACANHRFGSERQGLAMFYYAMTNNCQQLDTFTNFLEKYMLSEHGLIYWKLDANYSHANYQASASIDDLRIVQALLTAYENLGKIEYYDLALHISRGLKEYTTYNNSLTQGASWDNEGVYTNNDVYLSYINLPAMTMLTKYDSDWQKIKNNSGNIVINGAYGNGLFHDIYNYSTQKYSTDTTLNSIHQATIGLNLASYNKALAQENLNFWKSRWQTELMEGKYPHIASEYSPSGEPLCQWCADVSVYALIAMLAHELDDTDFENEMINALIQLNSGQYSGAFSWGENYQLSSYPNTLALIALARQRLP